MKKDPPQVHVDTLALKRILIFNEKKEKILVSSLWENHSVVMIFLRHFGCIACRAHVDKVWKKRSEFEKTGVKLVFIGNGSPEMICAFKEELKISDAPIYTDPTLEIFDACGLNRGLQYLLHPKSALQLARLYKDGYAQSKQKKENGSHTQMGGIVAIKPPGIVTYYFASEFLGEFDDTY